MRASKGTKSGSVFRDVYYRSIYSDDVQRKRLLNSAKGDLFVPKSLLNPK